MAPEIRYVLMDPSKNRTILVETPVPPESQPSVAARLMEQEPAAEQVGFLSAGEDTDISLRMAGGEFCGNASMSAAVYYAMRAGMTEGHISVRVSGTPEPVPVTVSEIPGPDGKDASRTAGTCQPPASGLCGCLWQGIVDMPRPLNMEEKEFPEGHCVPVVTFRGITHVLLNGKQLNEDMSKETAEALARAWCAALRADALGLMFLNEKEKRLTPLVYVPAADTLFWESTCASGTTAAGAWLAKKAGHPVILSLSQPGGVLEISAAPGGPLLLKGTVRCEYRKTVPFTHTPAAHAR